jgi:hypothetical protein
MAKRKRTKRNIMLNKTPTREEKIEQNEPHQKCFYKKGGGHKYSGRVSTTLFSS